MFPSDLKQSKVIPLHKGGSRLDENNYRPISLLKVWSKIFESAMFVRLYQYFVNFNLLYGYNQSPIKNRSGKGGGVMLQVKSNCSILNDIPVNFDEAICADIENSGYKLRTLVVYNKPRTDKMEFIDLLDHNLEQLSQTSLHFVVCGDLNINVLESNLLENRYKTCIESNGFEVSDLALTRITSLTSSCIDHMMYQNIVNPNSELLSFQSFSDHFPVVLTWSFKTESSHNPTVFRDYSFRKCSESFVCYVEALSCELSKDMKDMSLESCDNDAFNTFNSCFTSVLNQFAPLISASNAAKSNSPV